ncbi:MAG: hypothetical protein HY816_06340 [Candidatus Wallbacteria bacterium]|nr:hypothetical protein [Candidatus Wallbacteria bacterium]
MPFIWEGNHSDVRPATLVGRIEEEVLYVLRNRGRSELRFLLVLLDDEFPEAKATDLAQAVGNLIDHGLASVGRCDHSTADHMSCGCITLELANWLEAEGPQERES